MDYTTTPTEYWYNGRMAIDINFANRYSCLVSEVRAFCVGQPTAVEGIHAGIVQAHLRDIGVYEQWNMSRRTVAENLKPMVAGGVLDRTEDGTFTLTEPSYVLQALAGYVLHFAECTIAEPYTLRQVFGETGEKRTQSRRPRSQATQSEQTYFGCQYLSILLIESIRDIGKTTKLSPIIAVLTEQGYSGHLDTIYKQAKHLVDTGILSKQPKGFFFNESHYAIAAIELAMAVLKVQLGDPTSVTGGIAHAHRITKDPDLTKAIIGKAGTHKVGRPPLSHPN